MDHAKLLKVAGGAVFFAIVLNFLATTRADPDLWGYMAFGRLFWEKGVFYYHDIFTYLPTLPKWVYHEWGTGVLFYPLYQAFGGAGLQLLKYTLGLATITFIFLTARLRGATVSSAAPFVLLVAFFFLIGFRPVRAHAFTYTFFALSLYLLEKARLQGKWRPLWLLIPLQVLWCNLHGGFLAGLGLIALYAVGEALSRRPFWIYVGILAPAALATLINPYGLDYWKYLFAAITMPRPEIVEWHSLPQLYLRGLLNTTEFLWVAAMLCLIISLALWARWRELTPLFILAFTLFLGMKHFRHFVFFLILAGAYCPPLLSSYLKTLGNRPGLKAFRDRLGWKILLPLAGFFLVFLVYRFLSNDPFTLVVAGKPEEQDLPGLYYPVEARRFIERQGLSGNLLTEFGWGEYLLWELYPRCLVALDGRYETVYPEEVCLAYFDFIKNRAGGREFLDRYPHELVLIDSRQPL